MNKLRILYVGNFFEPWMSEEYIAKSFEALGHYVKRRDETNISDDNIIEDSKRGYDFLLYSKLRIKGSQENVLKNVNIPKVCWFFDIYPKTIREKRLRGDWVQMADYFFTTDNGNQEFYKKMGRSHECIRQGIYHEEAMEGKFNEKLKTKIFFAGAQNHWFSPRQQFLDFLQRTYKHDFNWPRRTTRQMRLNNSIASAKIVVGHNIRFPHYWSNRIYEMTGRGGFFITPSVDGLEEEFEDGKHIICYEDKNFDDLKSKIDYYLEHDDEREKIRKAGFEHCKNNFTYKHRCQELLNKIYEDNNSDGKRQKRDVSGG